MFTTQLCLAATQHLTQIRLGLVMEGQVPLLILLF